MADASDSKSDEGDLVWVQVPSPAYRKKKVGQKRPTFFLSKAERALNPGFKVYAPLRSAQSRSPPDLVRPISCMIIYRIFLFLVCYKMCVKMFTLFYT